MKYKTLDNVIGFIKQFVDFEQKELDAMLKYIEFIHLNKNDIFIQEGEIADRIAFTNKGYLRVYYNHEGDEISRHYIVLPLHYQVLFLKHHLSK